MAIYETTGSDAFPSHEDVTRILTVVDDTLTAEALHQLDMWRDEDDIREMPRVEVDSFIASERLEEITVRQRLGSLSLSSDAQRYMPEAA